MNDIVISPLEAKDLGAVASIHAACFDDAWSPKVLRKILAMPGSFGIAPRRQPLGGVAGFALGRVEADECELLSLAVAPEHRRRGLGAMLLDAAMVHAAAVRASGFFLEVAEDNRPALKLYQGRGLVPVGRRPDYYELRGGGYTASVTMRCDLRDFGERMEPLRRSG